MRSIVRFLGKTANIHKRTGENCHRSLGKSESNRRQSVYRVDRLSKMQPQAGSQTYAQPVVLKNTSNPSSESVIKLRIFEQESRTKTSDSSTASDQASKIERSSGAVRMVAASRTTQSSLRLLRLRCKAHHGPCCSPRTRRSPRDWKHCSCTCELQ
jgi:hypothetical protein